MKITAWEKYFIAISDYKEKDILKSAGFRWSTIKKVWYTEDAYKAKKFIDLFDEKALELLSKKEETMFLSSSVDTEENFPAPYGKEYYGFQKVGIKFSLDKKNVLIADEMGLGKTIQAIGVINTIKPKSVIIICPAMLKNCWKNELEKWLVDKYDIVVMDTKKSFPNDLNKIIIINYDIVSKFKDDINKNIFDLLICDEAHYLKNSKAERTKAVLGSEGAGIKANKTIFLTGTPILNRPIDLYTILKYSNLQIAKNWKYFVERYCGAKITRFGYDVSGSSNEEELQNYLRQHIMIRRLKKDVLTELPAKTKSVITITEDITEETEILNKMISLQKEIKACEDLSVLKELNVKYRVLFTEATRIRHETALKKVKYVVDFVKETLEDNLHQIVIFAHHKDVIENIYTLLKEEIETSFITGDISIEEREKRLNRFRNNEIKVLILSIKAAGVGITLTNCNHVIFAELDWTPANILQAEDRCHRIGQKDNVLIQYLVFENSIESYIAKTLVDKEETINLILNIND